MALRHPKTDLLRYREGALPGSERAKIETHLASCAECRGSLEFVEDFAAGLRELSEPELTTKGPCPAPELIAAYQERALDEADAKALRAHLLLCDKCTEELYALERSLRAPSWTEVIVRVGRGIMDLIDVSGTGQALVPAAVGVRSETADRPAPIQMEDVVVDDDAGMSSRVQVFVDQDSRGGMYLHLHVEPPQPDWRVSLAAEDGEELARLPLAEEQAQLGSGLEPRRYRVAVTSGDRTIGEFLLDIRPA